MRAHTRAALIFTIILVTDGLSAPDAVAGALQRIHRQYLAAGTEVGLLVLLDQELRQLLPEFDLEGRTWISSAHLKPEYADIGVAPAAFEADILTYSGKLLREAHAVDPDSAFRSYTLFSTVFRGNSTGVPSPQAGEAYLREFPRGPFAVDTHLILAHFYDDLSKVVLLEQAGRRIDYKYDCFAPFLTVEPLAEQRRKAREAALRHYRPVMEAYPSHRGLKRDVENLRQEKTHTWFYCGD